MMVDLTQKQREKRAEIAKRFWKALGELDQALSDVQWECLYKDQEDTTYDVTVDDVQKMKRHASRFHQMFPWGQDGGNRSEAAEEFLKDLIPEDDGENHTRTQEEMNELWLKCKEESEKDMQEYMEAVEDELREKENVRKGKFRENSLSRLLKSKRGRTG